MYKSITNPGAKTMNRQQLINAYSAINHHAETQNHAARAKAERDLVLSIYAQRPDLFESLPAFRRASKRDRKVVFTHRIDCRGGHRWAGKDALLAARGYALELLGSGYGFSGYSVYPMRRVNGCLVSICARPRC